MKWLRTLIIFDQGDVISSKDWATVHKSFVNSIQSIDHPRGSKTLTLRRKTRVDGKWKRNGVGYLRARFLEHMVTSEKWKSEGLVDLARTRPQVTTKLYPSLDDYREPITSEFGGFDFATTAPDGTKIAIEWETGNISSSHRSLNKLCIALSSGIVQVGVLIVPSRTLYEHLTDRIGNVGELSPYLSFWESVRVTVPKGLLAVAVVEQDALTNDESTPYLVQGKDGNAEKA
ncbi:hypothetical protein [Bradyrhizobium sp. SZCCHNS1012]|uniref:hypothetical protein n=1 Tax=Bradyrhizobium sp. SZCCHNS1012 TaxID=3057297 RepID=UPI0029162C6F|nr:hypothetical protein [Bradyrhizobium sp. SZCCHNS1012]